MQSTTNSVLTVSLVALVLLASVVEVDSWYYSRRSTCAETNRECDETYGCCSRYDTCVSLDDSMLDEDAMYVPTKCMKITPVNGNLPDGSPCTDSRQCYTGCCQEFRGHRYGTIRKCGSQYQHDLTHKCVVLSF